MEEMKQALKELQDAVEQFNDDQEARKLVGTLEDQKEGLQIREEIGRDLKMLKFKTENQSNEPDLA